MVAPDNKKEVNSKNTDNAIYFDFSYAALKLLGKNLYSNAANAISELVANGLDAKAKKVYVYIDMSDKEHSIIEIIDDGLGMDYNDLASKYVWIGRNKRNDEEVVEEEKKNLMGRKGIGKLAALYLSNNYYILTKKKGDSRINQWEINLSKYQDSDFPKLDRISQKINLINENLWEQNQQGTAIVLNNVDLRRNGTKRIEALKRVFADYYLVDELTAKIYVAVKTENKSKVKFEQVEKNVAYKNFYAIYDNTGDSDNKSIGKYIQYKWLSKYEHIANKKRDTIVYGKDDFCYKGKKEFKTENGELIEKEYELHGWIGVHSTIEVKNAIDKRFIRNDIYQPNKLRIYVRNKLAVADFFEMHPSTQIGSNYIEGDISFNILDDDDLPDIATSSRQDFLDDERVELLISLIDPIVNAMFKVRNDIGQKIRKENEDYEENLRKQEEEKRIQEESARRKAEEQAKQAEQKKAEAEKKQKEAEKEKQLAVNRAEKLSVNLGSEKKRNHFLINSLDDDQLNFAKRLHMIRINASTISKVIKNNVNKLKRGKFKEDDAWNLLKKISYLNSRMQAVLEYSAMAKFNTKEEFIEDNLFEFIEEYCENVLAQNEDIKVEVLREDENGVIVRFVPQDIAVILDNVISNSIKYNATLLKIVLNRDGDFYTINFIDNGDGLEPNIEDVSELFEFGKGYTFTGTGVGLYHIKSIVEEELKGTVDINLEETKGFDLMVRFKKYEI
ncbi:MAG: sensor histidine kinase [Eubacteriales bacterium]|nr:sensor histidine kinase [Eubacteriales bacterium]